MKKNAAVAKRPGRLRAAWAALTGGPMRLTEPGDWESIFGASVAGQDVNNETILRLSTVWSCTRLIAESIAQLPLSIYERTPAGKRIASQHGLQLILHSRPNADSTASLYWESVVAAMLLRGRALSEKLMIGERVVGLSFLAPARTSGPHKRGDGSKFYRFTNEDGRQREIPASRVWVIPGFSLDGKNGCSVIRYGASVFGSALAADNAATATFKNGMMKAVYFRMEKLLTKGQREEFRESLEELQGAINAGKSPLLEGGMDAKEVGISPADAQLLQSRGWSVEEICRWFRTPPWMVGHTEKSTSWGTGIEQQMIGFLTFTLAPWLRRIEQSIDKDLLTPAENVRYYAKYSVEGLLRADSAGRAAFYAVMVDKGILTRDEVRELEDRVPMGGNAAVLTVQSAMTTLDSLGASTTENQARAALRALLGLEDNSPQPAPPQG